MPIWLDLVGFGRIRVDFGLIELRAPQWGSSGFESYVKADEMAIIQGAPAGLGVHNLIQTFPKYDHY